MRDQYLATDFIEAIGQRLKTTLDEDMGWEPSALVIECLERLRQSENRQLTVVSSHRSIEK
ncbi:hypothetical protein [Hyphomicrobium sp.]|uniref:hypothetical protein n=1 Tax=Hyphomicrobium sp. TaxID=82 RepID=UPI002BE401DD|nr:hypothetical protein [Hyphomicrobium sp.]HVZ06205.1 hypothetical protein [Hyphomicrobium sp.]